MKLYYSPGACSLSPHIALLEAGLPYDLVKVDLRAKKLENGDDFWAVNPKGQVPALALESGELVTEGPVIIQMIADDPPQSAGITVLNAPPPPAPVPPTVRMLVASVGPMTRWPALCTTTSRRPCSATMVRTAASAESCDSTSSSMARRSITFLVRKNHATSRSRSAPPLLRTKVERSPEG